MLAKTQKECKEKLQRAIEENAKVDAIRAKQYTVGQWMDNIWFENCAKIKVRPSSHKTYRGYIDNHIKPNMLGHYSAGFTLGGISYMRHLNFFLAALIKARTVGGKGAAGT